MFDELSIFLTSFPSTALDLALKSCKIKRVRRDKSDSSKQRIESVKPEPASTSAEVYTFNDEDDVEQDLCVVELPESTFDQSGTASETSFVEMSAADKLKSQTAAASATPSANANAKTSNKKIRRTRRGSGTSSDEERWLNAIESGKLEQVDGEMKKMKDPKLMTARQRAMYERSIEKDPSPADDALLLALPTGYKEKVMTAEAIEKAQMISKKRKQLADERREKNKRETMDRLLKKQESKVTKVAKNKIIKITVPVISYYDSVANGSHVSYPIDMEFPIKAQLARTPPTIIPCAVCNIEQKRYNCSKTNIPLCSFECYQLNLQQKHIEV